MRRATTPVHEFTLDIDPSLICKIRITYTQKGCIIVNKKTQDITLSGNVAIVKFTQEETNRFKPSIDVKYQVRILTTDGEAIASDTFTESVECILDDEVLV